MLSLTVIMREVMLKFLSKDLEELGVPQTEIDEILMPPGVDETQECEPKVESSSQIDFSGDKLGSETPVPESEIEVFELKGLLETSKPYKVFESSMQDIRLLFTDAIEEYYSETGGPSSYEEKMVVLLEMYLKKFRSLSWKEKLNAAKIRKFVLGHIKGLCSPPKIVVTREQVLASRLYLTSRDEGYYENLRNKFLANIAAKEQRKAQLGATDVQRSRQTKKKSGSLSKFFKWLNPFKKKNK